MEKVKILASERSAKVTLPDPLGFGVNFTDHLFEMDYNPEDGWHNPVIKPVHMLSMHPASMFIHYGQAVFEGLKAFKTDDGEVVIFRPRQHFERLK